MIASATREVFALFLLAGTALSQLPHHASGGRSASVTKTRRSPTLARRLAFLRGAARQFGRQFASVKWGAEKESACQISVPAGAVPLVVIEEAK